MFLRSKEYKAANDVVFPIVFFDKVRFTKG